MTDYLKRLVTIIKHQLNKFPFFKALILKLVVSVPGLKNMLDRIGHSKDKEPVILTEMRDLTTRGRKIYLDLLLLIKKND